MSQSSLTSHNVYCTVPILETFQRKCDNSETCVTCQNQACVVKYDIFEKECDFSFV